MGKPVPLCGSYCDLSFGKGRLYIKFDSNWLKLRVLLQWACSSLSLKAMTDTSSHAINGKRSYSQLLLASGCCPVLRMQESCFSSARQRLGIASILLAWARTALIKGMDRCSVSSGSAGGRRHGSVPSARVHHRQQCLA